MAVNVRYRRYTTGIYLIGYAVIRFDMEYLRGDPRAAVGPFSISQTISLAMAAFGVLFLFVSVCSKRASGVSDE
jgi:prolipoprotein diacylglyceryltransferase